jgi:predicted nucleotidyltransferase
VGTAGPTIVLVTIGQTTPMDPAIPTVALLRARKPEIVRVAAGHGASNIRVFGSVARGTACPHSDVDLLVDFEPGRTLLDHVGLWRDLEALLGRAVDVVSAGGLTDRDDDIRADSLVL